jgi:hypothetical protein
MDYNVGISPFEFKPELQSINNDRVLRLFAVECAAVAFTYCGNGDLRSLTAIEVGRRYAEGNARENELHQAYIEAEKAVETADETAFDARDAFEEGSGLEEAYHGAFAVARAVSSARCCCHSSALEAANDAVYEAWAAFLTAAAQNGNTLGGLISPEAPRVDINNSIVSMLKEILRKLNNG